MKDWRLPQGSCCVTRTSTGSPSRGPAKRTAPSSQKHRGTAPLAVPDQQVGGDGLRDVAVDDRQLHQVPPPFGPVVEQHPDRVLRNLRQPDWRFGLGDELSGPTGEDGNVAEPENRVRIMHEGSVSPAQDRPHRNDAVRKPDEFAFVFATGLDRLSRLEAAPRRSREDRLSEFSGGGAQPATGLAGSPSPLRDPFRGSPT